MTLRKLEAMRLCCLSGFGAEVAIEEAVDAVEAMMNSDDNI